LGAARAAINFVDDGVRKRNPLRPEVLELVAHPGDRPRVVVFPDNFVVVAPTLPSFVVAAYEGERRTVVALDDPGLAMKEWSGGSANDAHGEIAANEQFVEFS